MSNRAAIEKALTKPMELYRLMADHLAELICLRHVDGTVFYASPSVERLLGYSPGEFIDGYANILVNDSELNKQALDIWRDLESQGIGNDITLPIYHLEYAAKNGERVIHEVRERGIYVEDELVGLISVSVDVTEQHSMVEELKWSNQELAIIHHTQKQIMERSDRNDLLEIALESSLSLQEYNIGAMYDLNLENMQAKLISSKRVSEDCPEAQESFDLSKQIADGTIGPDIQTTSVLLPPGHSWLTELSGQSSYICGILIVCHGNPEALITIASDKLFNREVWRLLQLIGNLIAHAIDNTYLHSVLEEFSVIDTETGLYNRAYVDRYLAHEQQVVNRFAKDATILRVDLPLYRKLKTEGLIVESKRNITEISKFLKKHTRSSDLVARYTEDELLVYLPETDADGAETMLARFRELQDQHNAECDDGSRIELVIESVTVVATSSTIQNAIDQAGKSLSKN